MKAYDDLESEVRSKLDGGLNTRASPFVIRKDQVVAIENFRYTRDGSLVLRDGSIAGGDIDDQIAYPAPVITAASRPTAPTVAAVAGGSIAAADYRVKLFFRARNPSVTGKFGPTAASATVTLAGANASIEIRVRPNDLGLGAGRAAGAVDDPFMGCCQSDSVEILVAQDTGGGFGAFDSQGFVAFTWDNTNRWWEYTLTTYAAGAGGDVDTPLRQVPISHVFYHPISDQVFYLQLDTWYSLQYQVGYPGGASGTQRWGQPVDSAGTTYFATCRQPFPKTSAIVSRIPVIADGFKPKKMVWGGGITNGSVRMLGANPPTAAPSIAVNPAAGVLNGAYRYKTTLVYRNNRPADILSVESWDSESNASAQSNSVSPANKQIDVTINASTSETGLQFVRVYRTQAGGTNFFFLTDVASPFANFTDNTADGSLDTDRTPPDAPDKEEPADLPPDTLLYVIEHDSRVWGVNGTIINATETDNRVLTVIGTNEVVISKQMDETGLNDQSTIDHFPNTTAYRIICGRNAPITQLVSHRGQVYVFKEDEIGVIVGGRPGEYVYQQLFVDIGAQPHSVVPVSGVMYFWNPEKAGYIFDGASYRWIGEDIQETRWSTDRDADYWCYNVIHDRQTNEVRWSMTNLPLDPTTILSQPSDGEGTWKEYVAYVPTNAMTLFTSSGARQVHCATNVRESSSRAPQAARKRVLFGTTRGRLLLDHGANNDQSVTYGSTSAISFLVEFADFLGQAWDVVKNWRYVLLAFEYTGSGSWLVRARYAQTTIFATIATISAATTGLRTQVIAIPQSLTEGVNQDRGLRVRLEGTMSNNTLIIRGIVAKYKPISALRGEVT